MTAHVARVSADSAIRIYRDDEARPIAIVVLPPGAGLRETLELAGWRPTGRRTPSGGWGSIYVEPTRA